MIKVSEEFKKAVYAPSRMCGARVTFEMVHKKAQLENGRDIDTTEEAPMSRKQQLTDSRRQPSYKYATFEPNRFKLDGSFRIPPKSDEATTSEVGWLSDILSDDYLEFPKRPTLTFNFLTKPLPFFGGIHIIFDPLGEEYATDFSINFEFENSPSQYISVENNKRVDYQLLGNFDYVKQLSIRIEKWSKPYRRARVVEVSFGIIQIYNRDEIINFNLLKEIDPLSTSLPSDELKFTIDNSKKDFNILTPNSLYKYLIEKQEILVEMGVEIEEGNIEYIQSGKYYLSDWKSDEGSLTASFTARDIFEYMKDTYKNSKLYTSDIHFWGTLYEIAEDILKELDVPYELDLSLRNLKTQGYLPPMPYREALQLIANAGGCAVYQSLDGKVIIKQLSYNEPHKVTLDNIYTDPQIVLDKQVKYINIKVNRLRKGPLKEFFNGEVSLKESRVLCIEAPMWNATSRYEPPIINVEGGTYTVIKRTQNEQAIKITSSNDTVKVVISGYEIIKDITVETIENIQVKTGVTIEVDNPLVNTIETAQALGQKLLFLYNNRANYTINWRQNPYLECGDTVLVENPFGDKKSIITKQTFEYDGALKGTTESRGEI